MIHNGFQVVPNSQHHVHYPCPLPRDPPFAYSLHDEVATRLPGKMPFKLGQG